MKQKKNFLCTLCALFPPIFVIHFNPFLCRKITSSENKVFRVYVSFIKELHFQLRNHSIEKVKAFCLEYCNDDRIQVVIKLKQINRVSWRTK